MALSSETVSRWVSKRQTSQLHARADLIEQLAATAVELATLSTLEAERIAMTAILALTQILKWVLIGKDLLERRDKGAA